MEERKYDQAKKQAFEERLGKKAQGGAGQLRKWTKPVAVWKPLVQPEKVFKGPVKRCGPMEEVEEALQE